MSALILLGASTLGLAEESTSSPNLAASNLVFSIDRGDLGIFPLALDLSSTSALSYDLATGIMEINLAEPGAGRYLDPLFCFDFIGNGSVALRARDANGHLVIGNTPLGLNLSYILNNSEINYRPPSGVQCFYRGTSSGQFGLFGTPPQIASNAPEGQIFADRFEANEQVGIEFVNLASFRNPGDPLSYQIVVSNNGTTSLSNVAFQELAPVNADFFDASLTTADWSCTAGGGAQCPLVSEDINALRFSGLSLPVGATLTFEVSRSIHSNSLTGAVIDLHAGVVAGGSNQAPYDTATAEVVLIGSADSVYASPAQAEAGQLAAIEVTVLDSGLNPVPFVDVDLVSADGLLITPSSAQTSDSTGFALFEASTTQAGIYAPQFEASGAGTAIANVIITAAAPDSVEAEATVAQAIANGIDEVLLTVLVEDTYGNPVAATEVLVSGPAPDGVAISSPEPWTDINGQVQFLASSTAAGTYSTSFGAGGAVSDSVSFDFVAGAPAAITFEQEPTNIDAGATMTPPVVVRVLDAYGNWVADDNSTSIQLRLFQNEVEINPNFATAIVSNGETSFDNLVVNDPGEDYTLFAIAILPDFSAVTEMSEAFEVFASAP